MGDIRYFRAEKLFDIAHSLSMTMEELYTLLLREDKLLYVYNDRSSIHLSYGAFSDVIPGPSNLLSIMRLNSLRDNMLSIGTLLWNSSGSISDGDYSIDIRDFLEKCGLCGAGIDFMNVVIGKPGAHGNRKRYISKNIRTMMKAANLE